MSAPAAAGRLSVATVILAAGASSRMGRPKLLLPWGATSVLGHLISQWRDLQADQVAVVTASKDVGLDSELDRLLFPHAHRIRNPAPERGMFSSIQGAAQWNGWKAGLTHWVIGLGDQPHVRTATLRALLEFATAHPAQVCQPSQRGLGRHPVVLPASVFAQLSSAPEANLRQFLLARPEPIALCELDDPGLDFDLDTPEDYERACRLFQGLQPHGQP
jgi:molybdenum cofactor cytidylyltransferase